MPNQATEWSRQGNGTPLVLVHGFGLDLSIWSAIKALLSQQYDVITIGLPGLSATPFQPLHTMEALAAWLQQELTDLHLGPFLLAGHSMGGYLGLAYLQQFPEELLGLCLVHSHVFADSPQKQTERKKVAAFVEKNGTAAWAKVAIPPLFSPTYRQHYATDLNQYIDRFSRFEPMVIAHYLHAMAKRPDHRQTLQNSSRPIGLLMGTLDQHATYANNVRQVSLSPATAAYRLDGIAHMGMIEAPKQTAQALQDFTAWCGTIDSLRGKG